MVRDTGGLPTLSWVFAFVMRKFVHSFLSCLGNAVAQPLGVSWVLGFGSLQIGLMVASSTVQAYLPFPLKNPPVFLFGYWLLPLGAPSAGPSSLPLLSCGQEGIARLTPFSVFASPGS